MNRHELNGLPPVDGRLGVLTPGMGAVATTLFAGVEALQRGLGLPIGSVTQMAYLPISSDPKAGLQRPKDVLPLAQVDQLVFGGWDVFPDNAYQVARKAEVLEPALLEK